MLVFDNHIATLVATDDQGLVEDVNPSRGRCSRADDEPGFHIRCVGSAFDQDGPLPPGGLLHLLDSSLLMVFPRVKFGSGQLDTPGA